MSRDVGGRGAVSAAATCSGVPSLTNVPTAMAALGSDVDHMVCIADDIELVLNDQNGVALVHQSVQDIQQHLHVLEVQARRGLVQDVKGVAGVLAGQFCGEL